MRPPRHSILERPCLTAGDGKNLVKALGSMCTTQEGQEIDRLVGLDLPPVTSSNALAVLTGFNPGFIWSLVNRTSDHYRKFYIPKGNEKRKIEAPKVALKLVQKWLAIHFSRSWRPIGAVHGFIERRSHMSAASVHLGARWLVSVDIEDFFPSTTSIEIINSLKKLGYRTSDSLNILCNLCSLRDKLPQGAPTSPVLSNVALHSVDNSINELAREFSCRYTRYADDIVMSGIGQVPELLLPNLLSIFASTPWTLARDKTFVAQHPQRLKVHGLLVHGEHLRLTKGYRNRIRAYKHVMRHGRVRIEDIHRIRGHIQYADQIEQFK